MPSAQEKEPKVQASRVGSARRRLRAILAQIKTLEGSDFPHADGEAALLHIKKHFETLISGLDDAEELSFKAFQALCLKASVEVELHLPVLGFILRSTNVRNAFEAYDPLKRIVGQTVSSDAQLLISSEWDFVPFTYPMSLDVLPNFVLVGGPAHESDSAFLVPIAGHEIGHSAWRYHGIEADIAPTYTSHFSNFVEQDPDLKTELEEDYGAGFAGFFRDIGIKRVEELFCDAFALCLFGESYLYAFEHLTYPGGGERDQGYPKIEERMRFLLMAAERRGLSVQGEFSDGWRPSSDDPTADSDIDDLLDRACEQIYDEIVDAAARIVDDSGVETPSEKSIKNVQNAFDAGVPYADYASLADLLCAAWRMIGADVKSDQERRFSLVNELVLKSIEVSEFKVRTSNA